MSNSLKPCRLGLIRLLLQGVPSTPGIEPTTLTSPALAGRFFTSAQIGKPIFTDWLIIIWYKGWQVHKAILKASGPVRRLVQSRQKKTSYGQNEVKGSTSEVTEVISKGPKDLRIVVEMGGN